MPNYAFIDAQNLYLGMKSLGWKLDYRRFRVYLRDKYQVDVAHMFIGYTSSQQRLYDSLARDGYKMVFKPTVVDGDGNMKGNVDADLVLHTMIELPNFDRAVLVTSDGDFQCLVKHLYGLNKLEMVLSPSVAHCSSLLKKAAQAHIVYMDNLRKKLEYAPK